MSYTVKTTAGTTLVVVPDRHIDKDATPLALVGFNTSMYGLDHAENFVHLLENFANDVAPTKPMKGQFWYDTTSDAIKLYDGSVWNPITNIPSTSGDPTLGGLSGMFHCPVSDTSVALIFAGGKIVAVVANRDIDQGLLPSSVSVESTAYTFRSLFPFGLQGGVNLADSNDENNPDDYVFSGRVPLAEQAHFAGGGVDDAEVSGWAYIDIGPGKSVGLMISCGQVVAAVSSGYILNSDLPNSITFHVKKDRDTGTGSVTFNGQYKGLDANYNSVTCLIKSVFPGQDFKQWTVDANGLPVANPAQTIANVGLFPGLTFATAVNSNGGVNQVINQLITSQQAANANAIAKAVDETKVWVDANSATALKVSSIEATFTSATGTTSLASAVNSLVATARDDSATTTAITSLKAQFTTTLGTTSFGEALTKLQTSTNASGSNSSAITEIKSAFINKFGGTDIASAVSNLYTKADDKGNAVAGFTLALNSKGYVTGIQAANGGSSYNYIKVTTSNFIVGDNDIDFVPFEIKNGVVYIKNASIENLTIGIDKIKPGVSNAFKFSAPDVYIGGRAIETTMIETPYFSIGDANSGSAVAFICYFQDGRFARDTWQNVRVYVDIGNGFELVRNHSQQGFSVKSGDISYAVPVMFPVTFTSTKQCRVRVTSACTTGPSQPDYNYSYCRNIEVHVFQTAR